MDITCMGKCIVGVGKCGKDVGSKVIPGWEGRKQNTKPLLPLPVCSLIRVCSNNSGFEGILLK